MRQIERTKPYHGLFAFTVMIFVPKQTNQTLQSTGHNGRNHGPVLFILEDASCSCQYFCRPCVPRGNGQLRRNAIGELGRLGRD